MTLIFLGLIEYALVIVYVNSLEDSKVKRQAIGRNSSEDGETGNGQAGNGQAGNGQAGNGFPFGKIEDEKRPNHPVVQRRVKKLMVKVYGDVDWKKAPLHRNKVDYMARILFPLFYLLFILAFVFIFIIPWLVVRH